MDHTNGIYIVDHGWKDTSDVFGSIYVLMVLVKYHKVQGQSRCRSACCWHGAERAGVRSLVVDTCHAGFAVDVAADKRSSVVVIAGCSPDEVMPVFDGRSLFSLCWACGESVPDTAERYGYLVHPVWR